MLNLLKERFHLAYHMSKRDFDIYELVVGKKGPKLQDAEIPAELPTGEERSLMVKGSDGYPVLPPGWPTAMGTGAISTTYLIQEAGFMQARERPPAFDRGFIRFSFRMVTTAQLLKMLQLIVGGMPHAVDHTGLQGKYDVRLAFSPDPPRAGKADEAPESGPDLFSALEKQLALKLQKTKGPLDVVVIDHIDQVPVEN